MIPRAWLALAGVGLLVASHGLVAVKAAQGARDRAEARHAAEAERLTARWAEATARARTLQQAYLDEQAQRRRAIEDLDREAYGDPGACVPTADQLRRIERGWRTP